MTAKKNIAIAVSMALFSVAGSATAEVTLYDYTEATSAYEDAYLTGYLSAQNGSDDADTQSSYDAQLEFDYDKVLSSANRDITIDARAQASLERAATQGVGSDTDFFADISGTVDTYFEPNSKGAFWFAEASIGAQKSQESFQSDIGGGFGYGRVVNATPMAKTIRLVEALRTQGSLKAVPSKAAHQQVANIISKEDEYSSKYGLDSYEQYLFSDIEQALGQGTLGAGAIIKAYDVLTNENFSTRKIGWKVRAGVGVELSNYAGTDSGDPKVTLGAEYHQPLDKRTQFSNEAELSTTHGDDDRIDFDNVMKLTYELTDKIDWVNSWTLDHVDYRDSGSATDNYLSSQFDYSLDNQLSLGVSVNFDKLEGDDLDAKLLVDLGYRLR